MPYSSISRGMTQLGAGIGAVRADRQERKQKQKQDQEFLRGVEQIRQHPALADLFPEDFDPYEVGVTGTMAALDMVSRATQQRHQQAQADQAQMQTDRMRSDIAGEDRFRTQLRQTAEGVGHGVLRPEVLERHNLALQDPAVATSAQAGMGLEVARRYFPEAAGQDGFSADQMGQARPIEGVEGRYFVPTSRTAGQVVDMSERPQREHNLEQLVRLQRDARGSGDAEAEEIYRDAIDRVRGGTVLGERAQEFLAMTNPQLLADLTREQIAARRQGREPEKQQEQEENKPEEVIEPMRRVDDFFKGL